MTDLILEAYAEDIRERWKGLLILYYQLFHGVTEAELLKCKNFGMTSLTDIRQKLAQFGLELKKE